MTIVMHEHPAWTLVNGLWLRAFPPPSQSMAVVTGDDWRLHGPAPLEPDVVELPSLAPSVPASLKRNLTAIGAVARWPTHDLWDAMATAIIRQVIRADQARALHLRFRIAHGQPVATSHGELHLMPDAGTVADLPEEAFSVLGLSFKRRPLQAAAAAYLEQGAKWRELPPAQLVEELQTVSRVGRWTAGAATADFTHDWTLYPHGDLAVRKWAALAAPDVDWPTKESDFATRWRRVCGDQLGALTLFTLAWGAHHGNTS
ncbi:hypothetical protein [Actinomadura sp. DC4]|uniref:hypothetical protein n=1 Tax=Actinomadura sp. DC4 TaxID=3055069 RepID=UPI0025AFC81A|nr:hypothetical protein [Actinomadura sp. DC4]MDN3351194.1 hypothetical protein [Actinomadura sp. DC4]